MVCIMRRFSIKFVLAFLAIGLVATPAFAQLYRPHEPLDPAKAQSLPLTPLSIQTAKGKFDLQVEVADDNTKRTIGLMHRTDMALDRGMIFDFQKAQRVSFWMRNCFFAQDWLFLSDDGTVRFIVENTIPHNDKGQGPDFPVVSVLELKAGAVPRYGIKVGDKVTHAIFKKGK